MRNSTQLKAKIRNVSQDKGIEAEVILRNFMLERFLERIAASDYCEHFILKGWLLIASIVGIDTRSTMDMDTTIKGQPLVESAIIKMINDISAVPLDDSVTFAFQSIEEIHEDADYPGFRVSLDAVLDRTRQKMKIDITTGDFVTPREIEYSYNLMFEDRAIRIMAYNIETILAEKFETIITRGVVNTRMRDFYDIYILTGTQKYDMDIFRAAVENTVTKRGTSRQTTEPLPIIRTVATSTNMIDLWQKYQKKNAYAAGVTWEMAIDALCGLGEAI